MHAGPPLHWATHMLAAQMSPGGHAMPQPPQLSMSVVVSVQPVGQQKSDPVQTGLSPSWIDPARCRLN